VANRTDRTSGGSNADLIFLRRGLLLLVDKLSIVIDRFSRWALKWKDEACLGFTHFQPAQLVTVGKRATLWIQVPYTRLKKSHIEREADSPMVL
jgi:adenylosuccinate lyase